MRARFLAVCCALRPGLQIHLAEEVLKLGKPTILVLIHGGAMSLGHLKDKYPAIVDAFYGGEMGGELTNQRAFSHAANFTCLFPCYSLLCDTRGPDYFC